MEALGSQNLPMATCTVSDLFLLFCLPIHGLPRRCQIADTQECKGGTGPEKHTTLAVPGLNVAISLSWCAMGIWARRQPSARTSNAILCTCKEFRLDNVSAHQPNRLTNVTITQTMRKAYPSYRLRTSPFTQSKSIKSYLSLCHSEALSKAAKATQMVSGMPVAAALARSRRIEQASHRYQYISPG